MKEKRIFLSHILGNIKSLFIPNIPQKYSYMTYGQSYARFNLYILSHIIQNNRIHDSSYFLNGT